MIRRVKIEGYKSLKSVEIPLSKLTVFFGPNGVGKSNLMDSLGLLSRMATKKTIKEAFEDHRGDPLEAFYFGDTGVEGLLKQGSAEFNIEVDVELSDSVVATVAQQIREMREGLPSSSTLSKNPVAERLLRYELTVEINTSSGHLRVKNERLSALKRDGSIKKARNPFIEKVENKLHVRMEGHAHPTYRELGLDYTIVSSPLYPPHYPHIVAFREELSRWRFYYFEPKAMRVENPLKETDAVGPFGNDLAAFYNNLKVKQPAQFTAINKSLKVVLPNIERLDVELTREGYLQLKVIEKGVPYSSRVISEGTLRILGLMAITNPIIPATVLGFEEPENGVHPRRLSQIADLLKNASNNDTQVLVNTHSPLLPDYFDEQPDDQSLIKCTKKDRATVFTPFKSTGPLFKQNEIDSALSDILETSLASRLVRGDFDE
ncbi:MAG: AAA family ATPase [Syntrophothermus sp.]